MPATPTPQPRHGLPGKTLCALGRSTAGAMQLRSNLRQAVARLAQPSDVRPKLWIRGQLVVPCDRPPEAMRAGHAPSPLQRPIALFTVLVPIDGHALHQQAHDLLSVLRSRCRCRPHGWHILSQAQKRLAFRRRQRTGPLAAEPSILFLPLLLVPGLASAVSAQRVGANLKVEHTTSGPVATAAYDGFQVPDISHEMLPGATLPTSQWNFRQVKQTTLLNTQYGTPARVTITPAGRETVRTSTRNVEATRYSYTGDLRGSQWFDDHGRWVKGAFVAFDGSTIEYILQE